MYALDKVQEEIKRKKNDKLLHDTKKQIVKKNNVKSEKSEKNTHC